MRYTKTKTLSPTMEARSWNKAFETGIEEIDRQHQELFRIGSELYRNLEAEPGRVLGDHILDCLESLAMYAAFHFETEESLFDRYGYTDCEAHIQEHREFIAHLEGFDLEQADRDQNAAVRDLLSFISQWIFRHISKTDFRYTAHLKARMNITA